MWLNYLNNLIEHTGDCIENRLLCNQKVKLLLYISSCFEQVGLIENSFNFIDFAKKINDSNKNKFNGTDLDLASRILERELILSFRHKSNKNIESI